MKFTLSWLNKYVSTSGYSPEDLAEKLTMLGLEVDSVEELYQGLDAIIVARVDQIKKHPNADKLTLCEVFDGTDTFQVVCGAPNVHAGMVTALAKPGVRLPGDVKIKKSKVRGEVSLGMLCSWSELALSSDHSGIIELDGDAPVGESLIAALTLQDTMIEVDLTPNRPDCASVFGIAREVAGFTENPLASFVENPPRLTGKGLDYSITIADAELCPRYVAKKITNVTIGPSPDWMQRQLQAVGMRPINNVVDITNFVMLETGQPLHAFDFQKIGGKEIIVRRPDDQEKSIVTLDGATRTIDSQMLMICDSKEPIAVAGVMGGLDSEVVDSTTEILLESACFNAVSTRRTARNLNLPSEASYRFERGVDPELAPKALHRAIELMEKYCSATAEPDGIDVYPGKKAPLRLQLRVQRVSSLLGVELRPVQVAEYLTSIGFLVADESADVLEVTVPTFRIDVEREVDLVEEIARLVGYNEIPTTLPSIEMSSPKADPLRPLRKQICDHMTSMGFYEAINYSFVSEKHLEFCRLDSGDERRLNTRILNPLTEDQTIMRSLLLPGLLENIRHNINFQQSDIKLFEIGKTFIQKEQDVLPNESYRLCAASCGSRYPGAEIMHFSELSTDFFDIKGTARNLLIQLGYMGNNAPLEFSPYTDIPPQPYCSTDLALSIIENEQEIGWVAAVHPEVLKAFNIKRPVYLLELDLEILVRLAHQKKSFSSLPKFPSVKRDIALLIPDSVPAGQLLQSISNKKAKFVETVELFDVYRGKNIEEGLKSVALSVTYRSATKTLNEKSVEKVHQTIVNSLMSEFKARYREGSE